MADFSSEMEAIDNVSASFKNEQPKIATAVKNYISVIFSKAQVEAASAGGAAPNMTQYLILARHLLKSIQAVACVLPDPSAFAAAHPQSDDQTGISRIDEILRYKVLYSIVKMNSEKGNTSVNQLFGKSFILDSKIWPEVEKITRNAVGTGDELLVELTNKFLKGFARSLELDKVVSNQKEKPSSSVIADNETVADADADADYKLTWVTDFNGELKRRQEARIKDACERQQRESKAESQINDIRSALAANVEHQSVIQVANGEDQDEDAVPRVEVIE
jgi:hypothetical protein